MNICHAGMWWAALAAGVAFGAVNPEAPTGKAINTPLNKEPDTCNVESADKQTPDLVKPAAEDSAEKEKPRDQIPEKFWSSYFGQRPKNYLLDPQGLLDTEDYRNRLGFLKDHAGDSSVDLFVYVFKGNQDIPAKVRAEELIEKFFIQGRPAVIAFYFMGEPQRSVIYLSPSILDHVTPAERHHALESSIMKAMELQGAAAQFEAFLVQISIRVYWMEQMMNGSSAGDRQAYLAEHLAQTEQKKKHGLLARLQPIIDRIKPFMIPVSAVVGVLIVLMGIVNLVRRRAIHRFPEFDVEPRLGGAHAAGVGAVISFASSALPPASQRDQTRDYLRRA